MAPEPVRSLSLFSINRMAERALSELEEQQAIDAYLSVRERSAREVGEMFNVSESLIYKILREHKIPTKRKNNGADANTEPDSIAADIKALFCGEETMLTLAERCGVMTSRTEGLMFCIRQAIKYLDAGDVEFARRILWDTATWGVENPRPVEGGRPIE